jgi:hypothetical protein
MPLLTNIERRALARGAKENCQQNILDLLKARFNSVPESMKNSLKNIDDLAFLKQLLIGGNIGFAQRSATYKKTIDIGV